MNTTPRIFRFLILFASVSCFSPIALGQQWTGAGDGVNWFDAANWDDLTVPTGAGSFPSVSGVAATPFNVVVDQILETGQIFTNDTNLTINAATTSPTQRQAVFAGSGSTINIDADLEGLGSSNDAVINLNSGVLSGDLSLAGGAFNRTGGTIDAESLSVRNSNTLTLDTGDSVSGSTSISQGSSLTINGGTVDSVSVSDSTFNFNGGTVGDSIDLSNGAVFNNNSTTSLNLSNLSISDSDFELQAGDSSSGTSGSGDGTLVSNGAALSGFSDFSSGFAATLNGGSISGDTFLFGGTLNLTDTSFSGSLSIGDDGTGTIGQLNRDGNTQLDIGFLDVSGGDLTLESGDSVSGGASIRQGSSLTINGGTVTNSASASSGSTIILNSGSVDSVSVNDSTLDFNGGTIADSLSFSNGGTLERDTSALLNVFNLSVDGDGTAVDLIAEDMVNSLNLSSGAILNLSGPLELEDLFASDSTLNVFQDLGQTEGLFIDEPFFDASFIDGSTINLTFDSELGFAGELDEIFAIAGDQSALLQSLIDGGQINFSGTTEDVGVFFDAGNNRTSIGFVSTAAAIPEPSTLAILCALSTGMCLRRRR